MNEGLRAGYKRTEVGEIPEDWEVSTLFRLAEIRGGIAKNANVAVADPVSVHYLRVANVQDGYLNLSEMSKIQLSRRDLPRYTVLPGDVLMNEGGDLDQLGRGAIWRGEFNPCVHQNHVFVVRCKADLLPDYLNAWTAASPARRFFLLAGKQTTNLASISKSSLGELPVALPPSPEQRAIAAALGDVDALLGGLDSLIAKKRDLKQAAMQQLLTGQTRLHGFSGEWEVKRLGDVVEKLVGGGTPSRSVTTYWGNEVPWVTVKDFATFNPIQTQESITRVGLKNSASHLIPAGTLITSTRMALGKAVVYNVDVAINQDLKAIFLGSGSSVRFLNYWFEFNAQMIDELGSGSTVKGISIAQLKNLPFPRITLSEQTAIAAVLSDMDAELAALEARRDRTRDLKQAMMQELLTGKTRLVEPVTNIIPVDFAAKSQPAADHAPAAKAHNWTINEAVVVAVLVKQFGSEQYPLGRKRCTKLSYLMHRHVEHVAQGYLKKAAGPYNPSVKYKGPEGIAQKNGYIRTHAQGKFSGFVAAAKVAQAEGYFEKWYGSDVLAWLEQFRRRTNDELELLATVDMAVEDLRRAGRPVDVNAVKSVIHHNPEWEAKLEREIFSDANIARAIAQTRELFQ